VIVVVRYGRKWRFQYNPEKCKVMEVGGEDGEDRRRGNREGREI